MLSWSSLGLVVLTLGCGGSAVPVGSQAPQGIDDENALTPIDTPDGTLDEDDIFDGIDFSKACECPSSTLMGKTLTVDTITTGTNITTAKLFIDDSDGNLKLHLAPFKDPVTGDILTAANADQVKITSNSSTMGEVCGFPASTAENKSSKADIVLVLDTTASMGSSVQQVAASMQNFANDLAAANIDVKFGALTVGDAFATKKASSSAYTLGQGTAIPPAFDTSERPYFPMTSDVDQFTSFLDEVIVAVGNGSNGAGPSENYAAATAAALGNSGNFNLFEKRPDAILHTIVVGDQCVYTADALGDSIVAPYVPPTVAGLQTMLQADGAKVHAISRQSNSLTCSSGRVELEDLTQPSAGTYEYVGPSGVVDFHALNISDLIKNFWEVDVSGGCFNDASTFEITTRLEVTSADASVTQIQLFTFNVTLQ